MKAGGERTRTCNVAVHDQVARCFQYSLLNSWVTETCGAHLIGMQEVVWRIGPRLPNDCRCSECMKRKEWREMKQGGRRIEQNGWERLRYFTTLRNPPLSLSLSAFYLFQSVSGSLSSSQGSQRMINQIAEDLYWFWRCFRQIAAWEAYVLLLSEARDVSPQGSSTEKLSQPSSLHEVVRFWGDTEKWQQRFKEFTITRGPPCRTVGAH